MKTLTYLQILPAIWMKGVYGKLITDFEGEVLRKFRDEEEWRKVDVMKRLNKNHPYYEALMAWLEKQAGVGLPGQMSLDL